MRLHRLEFAGIGPFPTVQVIDFSRLSETGLFLLEGPTGSGKSTIIDAIVFALFGGVAGEEADDARLVSDYLSEGSGPYVELVFETGHGVYSIRRTPAFERAKARGSGTTTVASTVALTRLADPDATSGDPMSTRFKEVAGEIQQIVGLNKDQFISTVVLPQGEFARFLKASGPDRRPLLQRIFQTERYDRLQARLKEGGAAARMERADADAALSAALETFAFATGIAADESWTATDPTDIDDVDAVLASRLENLEAQARATAAAIVAAARDLADWSADLGRLTTRRQLVDRLRDGLRQREQLDQDSALQEQRCQERAAAGRAAGVSDAVAAAQRCAKAQASSAQAEQAARDELAEPDKGRSASDLAELRTRAEAAAAELGPMRELEQGIGGRQVALAQLVTELAGHEREHTDAATLLLSIPERFEALQADRDAAATAAAQIAGLQAAAQAGDRRRTAAVAALAAGAEHDSAAEVAGEALRAMTSGEAAAEQLRRRYLGGIAAELGAALVAGHPCPVCGSDEHPAPAMAGSDHVTQAELEATESAVRTLRESLEAARGAVATAHVKLMRLAEAAQDLTLPDADAACLAAETALAAATSLAARQPAIATELTALAAKRDDAQARHTASQAQIARVEGLIDADRRRLAVDEAKVEQACDGHPSVAARIAELRLQAIGLDAAVQAAGTASAAQVALADATADLQRALAREGFADVEAVRAAQRDPREIATLDAAIAAHVAQRARVEGILADSQLAGIDPNEIIDTTTAEAAVAVAQGQHQLAVDANGRAEATRDSARAAAAKVRAAQSAREAVHLGTEAAIRVADRALGRNAMSMDLATYVLVARFEAVVDAANSHMARMSDGRLQLVTHDDVQGRSKAGLGLRVLDVWTDSQRPAGTLSGGETFFTSLALALGLAGVVTAEAGGIDLDTLFIDEGFGSLSSDALEEVISVLIGLRDDGRTVGLVSHVEELKNRIPDQIRVRRDDEHGPSRITVTH